MDGNSTVLRVLNDELRQYLLGGNSILSESLSGLNLADLLRLLERLAQYEEFDSLTDPQSEHAFGAFEFDGLLVVFRIYYCDLAMKAPSPNPADQTLTSRVISIMLAKDYYKSRFWRGSKLLPNW